MLPLEKLSNFFDVRGQLARRLIMLIVLSSTILAVIASGIQLYAGYQRDRQEVTAIVGVIERSFRSSLANALWEFSASQVNAILDGIATIKDVRHVLLTTSTGEHWERGEALDVGLLSHQMDVIYKGKRSEATKLGMLRVGLTFEHVRARLWDQFWILMISNFIKTFLASLIMLALFRVLVTRHLRTIAAFVAGTDWLRSEQSLKLDRKTSTRMDDLDHIVQALNASKAHAHESFEKIEAEVEERRLVEAQLFEKNEALEQANIDLQRSNRDLENFAYIASHDLKEPLRAISNHTTFLLEDHGERLGEEGQNRLHRLTKLSHRMRALVGDLLFFSRLGSDDQSIEIVDIRELIIDIEAMLGDFLSEKNGRIAAETGFTPVRCSRAQLLSIFQNLIINGLTYNRSGHRTVHIGMNAALEHEGSTLKNVFYVRDNGIGIEPAFHDDVFRVFKRLHHERVFGDGTGAGLAFVRKTIESLGGRIWLESTPGEGTIFRFILGEDKTPTEPIREQASTADANHSEPEFSGS